MKREGESGWEVEDGGSTVVGVPGAGMRSPSHALHPGRKEGRGFDCGGSASARRSGMVVDLFRVRCRACCPNWARMLQFLGEFGPFYGSELLWRYIRPATATETRPCGDLTGHFGCSQGTLSGTFNHHHILHVGRFL